MYEVWITKVWTLSNLQSKYFGHIFALLFLPISLTVSCNMGHQNVLTLRGHPTLLVVLTILSTCTSLGFNFLVAC